jgi:hypothetical protein
MYFTYAEKYQILVGPISGVRNQHKGENNV